QREMNPAFVALRGAFHSTAWLLVGLVVVCTLHWWLNRAEAREARFVMALIETAIIARPGASAPLSGRLTELIAPDRSIHLPVAAFVFSFIAVSAGWTLLFFTARVKVANTRNVYEGWPKEERRGKVNAPASTTLPSLDGGGSPVRKTSFVTLTITPNE